MKYGQEYKNASDNLLRSPRPSDTNTVSETTEDFINSLINDEVPL